MLVQWLMGKSPELVYVENFITKEAVKERW
jgi:hypothetical protein